MKTSKAGIELIKSFEGLKLVAYKCPAGIWTIGYGSTNGIHEGDDVTEEEAENMLVWDLSEAEDAVNMSVDVDLRPYEFDALVSLAFNIGSSAFQHSTLVRLLNNSDRNGAALQFPRWDKVNGKPSKGLQNRRQKEMKMFRGGEQ